jgi:hypothetical protein
VKSALDTSEDEGAEEGEKDAANRVEEKIPAGKRWIDKNPLPEDVKAASQSNKRKVGILELGLSKGVSRTDLDGYLK